MRIAGYLLFVLMVSGSAQPLVISCEQAGTFMKSPGRCCKTKCHKQDKEKGGEKKDCDQSTPCNPFAGCSSSQYLPNQKICIKVPISQPVIKRVVLLNESIVEGFYGDCWNPPEIGGLTLVTPIS